MLRLAMRLSALLIIAVPLAAAAGQPNWVTSWAASVHGPYPIGNPSAQPNLSRVFPAAETGARDQSFRLIVAPGFWGKQARVRFANTFGTQPVTFDGAYAGLQWSGSAVMPGSNRAITFAGSKSVTIAPGASVWSDAVTLPFVRNGQELRGRKLAVSFHVAGTSGPMTWHAKALQSSYVTLPGAGAKGDDVTEAAFPYATASWYFLDALDMSAPRDLNAIVAFGDSITDGTASTINGDDRWPDVLARRLNAHWVVVNAGIGGNQVIGPAEYTPQKPFPGGPAALQRLERDVLTLSGVKAVIWLEGTNDFSKNGNADAEAVIAGMREGVTRMRGRLPGVKVIGATLTSALGSTSAAHGFELQDEKRKKLNEFIRTSGVFDGVADFDRATTDADTGGMRAEFVPDNTVGGHGDKLHPNRMGYQAMGMVVDLTMFGPRAAAPRRR
ncbi:MAG: GDSL-type esterase/lipase family protein [Burkholderiales bacterium]